MKAPFTSISAASSLAGAGGLLGLGLASVIGFSALRPLAVERQQRVAELKPDAVSLAYLRLSLLDEPRNTHLRLQTAGRLIEAGLIHEAREVLQPVVPETGQTGLSESQRDQVLQLIVELDHRAWGALSLDENEASAAAKQRLIATLHTATDRLQSLDTAEQVARVAASLGQLPLRASVLAKAARAQAGADPGLVHRADSAFLETGDPMGAAQLLRDLAGQAPQAAALTYARLALKRAREADEPVEAFALFQSLDLSFPNDPPMLVQGLALASAVGDAEALAIGERLLRIRPADSAVFERVDQLRRQLSVNPVARAQATLDLEQLTRRNTSQPGSVEGLLGQVALLEALARPEEALQVVDAALSGELANARALWDLKLDLHLRRGQVDQVLTTLRSIQERFDTSNELLYLHADLAASRGDLRGALALLESAGEGRGAEHFRRVVELAWELGDAPRVRRGLQALAKADDASAFDVERLWLATFESEDYRAATRYALEGFERFGDARLLERAVASASAGGSDRHQLATLRKVKRLDPSFAERSIYPQAKTAAYQNRVERLVRAGELEAAQTASERAAHLLASARSAHPKREKLWAALGQTQQMQAFSLAVQTKNKAKLAELYPAQQARLTPRQRVHVLNLLGRQEEAIAQAVSGVRDGRTSSSDKDALSNEAGWLTSERLRQVSAEASSEEIAGVSTRRAQLSADYWVGGELSLRLNAGLSRLSPTGALALDSRPQEELSASARVAYDGTGLELGVVRLGNGAARPFGGLSQRLLDERTLRLQARLGLNEVSSDSAALRLAGAEDSLAVAAEWDLGEGFYATSGAEGKIYRDHGRSALGVAALLRAGVGRNFQIGDKTGGNLRVLGYTLQQREFIAGQGLPQATRFVGVGAGVHRGSMGRAPVFGRALSYLVDGSLGWLVDQEQVGWSASVGLGTSVLGGDMVALSARASNALSSAPGFGSYGLVATYTASHW